MNILLALFLIIFEAVFEGLKIQGFYLASEIVELIYRVGVSLMAFAWLERNTIRYNYNILPSFLKLVVGYFLLRFALFDLIWNLSAGQHWDYYGTTKIYDKIMATLGGWGWFMKGCAGVWGLAWVTKWGNKY
jgi:hypothetical protein